MWGSCKGCERGASPREGPSKGLPERLLPGRAVLRGRVGADLPSWARVQSGNKGRNVKEEAAELPPPVEFVPPPQPEPEPEPEEPPSPPAPALMAEEMDLLNFDEPESTVPVRSLSRESIQGGFGDLSKRPKAAPCAAECAGAERRSRHQT